MSFLTFLSLLSLILLAQSVSYYTKVTHRTDPDAKCLDGSPASIYVHEGGDTSKILFYFIGGGSCGDNSISSTL